LLPKRGPKDKRGQPQSARPTGRRGPTFQPPGILLLDLLIARGRGRSGRSPATPNAPSFCRRGSEKPERVGVRPSARTPSRKFRARARKIRSRSRKIRSRLPKFRTRSPKFRTRERKIGTRVRTVRTRERKARARERKVRTRERKVRTRVRKVRLRARVIPGAGPGGGARARRAVLPGGFAQTAGAGVLWGGRGWTAPAAAALLRRNGEDGVPAGVLSPLRKTARHKLAGGILVFVARPSRLLLR
jgi:hypothetical protein